MLTGWFSVLYVKILDPPTPIRQKNVCMERNQQAPINPDKHPGTDAEYRNEIQAPCHADCPY